MSEELIAGNDLYPKLAIWESISGEVRARKWNPHVVGPIARQIAGPLFIDEYEESRLRRTIYILSPTLRLPLALTSEPARKPKSPSRY